MAEGRAKANDIEAQLDNYVMRKKAETEKKVAEFKAEEIKITGDSEAKLAKLLVNRRKYQVQVQKLQMIKNLAQNKDF